MWVYPNDNEYKVNPLRLGDYHMKVLFADQSEFFFNYKGYD